MASGRVQRAEKKAELVVRYGELEVIVRGDRPLITLGRDQASDLVIRERMASRAHGKIELRRDKFVLIDHSANGTYVRIDKNPEILLRREELVLSGSGQIAFGQSCSSSKEIVEFECER